jgi:hypothetical protein
MTKFMLDNSDFYLLNTFPHLWKLNLKLKVCNNLMVVCGHIEAKKLFIFSKKAVEIKYYKKYKKPFKEMK